MKRGFTLIELLTVITIVAILAVLGLTGLTNQTKKARDGRRKSDLKILSTAFEDYYNDHGSYPPNTILSPCGGNQLKPSLDQAMPCDPLTRQPYCYIADSSGRSQNIRILTALENRADPDSGRLGCNGPSFCGYEAECAGLGTGFNYGVSSTNITVANPLMPSPLPSPSAPTSPLPSPSPSPSASAAPSPSSSPLPSPSPSPGADGYIYACDQHGGCSSWDHFPSWCHWFNTGNCSNMCTNPAYWCIE